MKNPVGIIALGVGVLALWPASWLNGQTVTFDFDSGPAPPPVYGSLPVNQSIGGVTAHFAGDFSFQTDSTTFFHLSLFSGKYLDPKSLFTRALDIQFDQDLADISLTYATIDYQDNREVPSNIQITARKDSNVVGTAITHAAYGTDSYPMGTLSLSPTQAFNNVTIVVPFQQSSLMLFMADNITVTLIPRLNIALTDTNTIVISWPAPSDRFVLEQNGDLNTRNWVSVTNAVDVAGDQNQVILSPPSEKAFYRLARH